MPKPLFASDRSGISSPEISSSFVPYQMARSELLTVMPFQVWLPADASKRAHLASAVNAPFIVRSRVGLGKCSAPLVKPTYTTPVVPGQCSVSGHSSVREKPVLPLTPVEMFFQSTSSMYIFQTRSASTDCTVPWKELVWMVRPEKGTQGSPCVEATVSSQLFSSLYSRVQPSVKELLSLRATSTLPEMVVVDDESRSCIRVSLLP